MPEPTGGWFHCGRVRHLQQVVGWSHPTEIPASPQWCPSLVPLGIEVQTWVFGGLTAHSTSATDPHHLPQGLGLIAPPVFLLQPLLLLLLTCGSASNPSTWLHIELAKHREGTDLGSSPSWGQLSVIYPGLVLYTFPQWDTMAFLILLCLRSMGIPLGLVVAPNIFAEKGLGSRRESLSGWAIWSFSL